MTYKVPYINAGLITVVQCLVNYSLQQYGCYHYLHPDMTSGSGGYMTH